TRSMNGAVRLFSVSLDHLVRSRQDLRRNREADLLCGIFPACCASAGVESASTISTTSNRSGIGPSDRKVRGLNTATANHLPLSLAGKSHCGGAPVCLVSALASSHSEQRCDCPSWKAP